MIAVGSADGSDKVAISDRWRQTQSENVWKFSQTPTWDNAGVFGTHADMGKLMSLIPFPQIKNTPNGQGELILMGTNGAQSLNLQLPRDQWIDSQIQDTVLTGVGAASYLGTISRTSIWFIGQSGLFEFKRIQSNIVRNEALTSESADIQYYWDQSNSNMRLTQPLGYHDNKLLMGLYPQTETSSYGLHRFHKAWASYDLSERWRNGERLPRAWFGIQCAIRPIEWACLLVNRVERTYAISRDVDGKNRIYEQTNHLPYDVKDGKPKRSFRFSTLLRSPVIQSLGSSSRRLNGCALTLIGPTERWNLKSSSARKNPVFGTRGDPTPWRSTTPSVTHFLRTRARLPFRSQSHRVWRFLQHLIGRGSA
jgi:hypothetical protein